MNARVRPPGTEVESLLTELMALRAEMLAAPARVQARLDAVHPNFRDSAVNLLHYLVLRRRDMRPLQQRLASLGLSSLGRAEVHVLATLDAVLAVLHRLAQRSWKPAPADVPAVDFPRGQRLLNRHTNTLLGRDASGRGVRIMVTMPSEAADDAHLTHSLLQEGMDCMRVNCAHDDEAAWLRMVNHLRDAERALGRKCRVVMDLAGPKLRTGPLEPGPAVLRVHPQRDVTGHVLVPARVWLTGEEMPSAPVPPTAFAGTPLPTPCLPVPLTWLTRLQTGDGLHLTDARNARRVLRVVEVTARGCWAECEHTAYFVPGTQLRHGRRKALVGALAPRETAISLQQGDTLIVTRDLTPGRSAQLDPDGKVLAPAAIGCSIPDVFNDVKPGEAIWFDDGKIGGVVEQVQAAQVQVRITHTRVGAGKLRADKGINLPDSALRLAAMTTKDFQDLPFVARHADVVELSFANTARDVETLQQRLTELGRRQPAIVLKIETRRGFDNLPDMLLTAMRAPSCGVMIARGDLAVECGFERLAEVQEEILWICEAAHVPVIWATQVLETLAREGMPSRAEVTDAAMSHRAECVMLNKGPHTTEAVRVLNDILRRMQTHQAKKASMLRELRLAHTLTGRHAVRPAPKA